MLTYEVFYRQYGIRQTGQILSPRFADLQDLELPRNSIYHYQPKGIADIGPAKDEFLFRNIRRPIQVFHVKNFAKVIGDPRVRPFAVDNFIRSYHNRNRRYRWCKNERAGMRDPQVPMVYNYAYLNQMWKYVRNIFSEYNRWFNNENTVWAKMAEVCELSERQHFIEFHLPMHLPTLSSLRRGEREGNVIDQKQAEKEQDADHSEAEEIATEYLSLGQEAVSLLRELIADGLAVGTEGMNTSLIKLFRDPQSLLILEFWKWLGAYRKDSMFSCIPRKHYGKINLVIIESGKWAVLNLGVLDKWRKPTKEEIALDPELADREAKGFEPKVLQLQFLKMLLATFKLRLGTGDDVEAAAYGVQNTEDDDGLDDDEQPQATVRLKSDNAVANKATNSTTIGTVSDRVITTPKDANDSSLVAEDTGDNISFTPEDERRLEEELTEYDTLIAEADKRREEAQRMASFASKPITPESGVINACDKLAEIGMISAAEYARYEKLASSYQTIVAPSGNISLAQFVKPVEGETHLPPPEDIADIPTVTDKSMLKSSLVDFDKLYIENVLPKDIARVALSVQNAGVALTGYDVERHEDITGAYDSYTLRVTPVEGSTSSLHFKVPAIDEDGNYTSNGVKYRLRKQRRDKPIRKTGPDEVSLISYYGKTFVTRSEKRVNDYMQWLSNNIMIRGLDKEDERVTELKTGDVFEHSALVPRIYSGLAMRFKSFVVDGFTWSFDYALRSELYGEEAIKKYEVDGAVIAAKNKDGDFVIIKKDNDFIRTVSGAIVPYANFEQLLDIPSAKAPVEFAQIKVAGKQVPLAIVLGYEMGLSGLINFLGVQPRRVPAGQRLNMRDDEYSLIFADESLIFSRHDRKAALILGGFNEFSRAIRDFSVYEYDRKPVYISTIESGGLTARVIREVDLMYQMFIDPLTLEYLIQHKEPTDFRGLLMKATELLLTDFHLNPLSMEEMTIKGYERIAGAVYTELVRSLKQHGSRPNKAKHPVDLHPYAVWKAISQDSTVSIVQDINPINNLKDVEAVTYSGNGGRNSRTMTKATRAYHVSDAGIISEATKDSGDVGINTYMSANPHLTDLRGSAESQDLKTIDATSLYSTAALLAPAVTRDEMKRVGFISIQADHGIACEGYHQFPVRTGYEQVIAHRTTDMFAITAKKNGAVIAKVERGIIIEYDDKTRKGVELGRRYGNAGGLTIPHEIVTPLEVGDKFKKGDIIAYNTGFFEPDWLNPKQVVMKFGLTVKTVLLESDMTLEDSSVISKRIAEKLKTKVTKIKDIVVNFEQNVHRLVKVGDEVTPGDILCIIEDAVTSNNDLFDEESIETLRSLSADVPTAKVAGKIERIVVYYHGDKEDMSASLRSIVDRSDKILLADAKAIGKTGFTGSVVDNFRISGEPLPFEHAAIRVYITSDVGTAAGDKGVFANQMKTVFGKVSTHEIRTEDGTEIDAVFSQNSIDARVVLSPAIIGTTTTLLEVIAKKAVAIYEGR